MIMAYLLLSYTINENTPLYGSTPAPSISPYSQISRGDSSNTAILSIHNHTGTHVDAPRHFVDAGKAISDYSPNELIFEHPVIVDCPRDDATLITQDDLQHASHLLQKSDCLLLRTGFGKFRGEERYRTQNPGIAPETISWIRREYPDIRGVGIDSISISSLQYRDTGREAHKAAFIEQSGLGKPLLLIEDINLDIVSGKELGTVILLPWQIDGLDSAPCSVIAIIKE